MICATWFLLCKGPKPAGEGLLQAALSWERMRPASLSMNNSSLSSCSRGCEAAPGNTVDEFIWHGWACVQADGIPQSRVLADSGTHRHTRKPCFLEETGGSLSFCNRRQWICCLYHMGKRFVLSWKKKGIFHLAVSLTTPAWQRVNRWGTPASWES